MELLIKFVFVVWGIYILYTIVNGVLKRIESRKSEGMYSMYTVHNESGFNYRLANGLSSKKVLNDLMNFYGTWSNTLIVHDNSSPEFVEIRRVEGSFYKNKTWESVENYLKGQIKKGSKIVVINETHKIKVEFYKL